MEITKYILFKLDGQPFVINVEQVRSIEKWQEITSVPKSSRFIKGVTKLRGKTTPIIDLKERLMQKEVELTDETRILVVFIDDMQIGFIVDTATEVIDISSEAIEPAPKLIEGVDSSFIKGVANSRDQLIILINAEKVIDIEETEELQEVIEEEQEDNDKLLEEEKAGTREDSGDNREDTAVSSEEGQEENVEMSAEESVNLGEELETEQADNEGTAEK